jgi:hypothetical protein
MQKLPIGIQTFSELIEENYVYVDKTAIIYDMISSGKYYFLSRPRRFGKSLLVSTLADIFSGNKELFDGLAIQSLPYDWKKFPVIMMSFSDIPCKTPEALEQGIKNYLQEIARQNQITLNPNLDTGEMLRALIIPLSEKGRVALLIDEYDYPILQHIHDIPSAHAMRETLKTFYGVIKGLDKHLKFGFLTGVSKFSQTSIFSGLNNLNDISLNRKFNSLLGYTKDEIITHFQPHLLQAAEHNKCSMDELLTQITEWYDGYVFTGHENITKMYNPFSVLLFLSEQVFSNYWFKTGTPTFLINLFKKHNYPVQEFDHTQASERELGSFEIENISLKTLLFQTGYLTINKYDAETNNYTLTYPNKETTNSLVKYLFTSITDQPELHLNNTSSALLKAFENYDFEKIKLILTQFFASIPYTIKINAEKYYQTIFYVLLKVLGAEIIVEQPTNIGRIDAVIQTKNRCFVIEMKINDTANAALKQIRTKKYYQPYELLEKEIVLIGIKFDTKLNNISEIKQEML